MEDRGRKMVALVTGASSGIGRDIARELAARGIDLVLTARRTERLEELAKELSVKTTIISCDLSREEECFSLYEQCKGLGVTILINNAGFGQFGTFADNDIRRELDMLDVNVRALQILMKLFLCDFRKAGGGYILNVASSAAFQPGPMMGVYYATKAYVLRLSEAAYEEERRAKSGVHISVLCPGPVQTEFDIGADVHFSFKGLKSDQVAKYTVRKLFGGKLIIVPGVLMKFTRMFGKFLPEKWMLRTVYHLQSGKQ